ncbi:peptidase [Shigella dysenteriae]|nr:peptidase [Shigella dysenteriae]
MVGDFHPLISTGLPAHTVYIYSLSEGKNDEVHSCSIRSQHSKNSFVHRAIGNSMTDIGLYSGDLMVVDKAEQPRHGDIVIAEIEGEFTVKRLLLTPRPALQAMNPDFPSLYPDPETLQIFGVVTAFIHKTRRAD